MREVVVHFEKWLRLTKLYYLDEKGQEREWDCCERTTRHGECDGVDIIARVKYGNREDDIVLCVQYRPPMRSYCVEFPAGLVDKNETVQQAALRELKEECGFHGEIVHVSPILGLEVGLSNSNCRMVSVNIDATREENKAPKQALEDGEQIEVLLVPISQLMEQLVQYSKEKGYCIDAKVWTFAQGIQFNK